MIIVGINMFPGLEESSSKIPWYQIKLFSLGKWQISVIIPIIFLVFLILIKIIGNLFQPLADRYKLRKRSIKL